MFTCKLLHPNAAAEHSVTVRAKSARQARAILVERLAKQYGIGHWFFVGAIKKAVA